MKYIKLLVISVGVMALGLVPVFGLSTAASAQADIDQGLCSGANLTLDEQATCNPDEANDAVNNIVTTVINIFSWIVGVVCVIMIIYGGFKYVTAGGDSNNVTSAKNTILYAIVGLVIVALAQVIVKFVLAKVTPEA